MKSMQEENGMKVDASNPNNIRYAADTLLVAIREMVTKLTESDLLVTLYSYVSNEVKRSSYSKGAEHPSVIDIGKLIEQVHAFSIFEG